MNFGTFAGGLFMIAFYFVGKFVFSYIWRIAAILIDEKMQERHDEKMKIRKEAERANMKGEKVIGFKTTETICAKKES